MYCVTNKRVSICTHWIVLYDIIVENQITFIRCTHCFKKTEAEVFEIWIFPTTQNALWYTKLCKLFVAVNSFVEYFLSECEKSFWVNFKTDFVWVCVFVWVRWISEYVICIQHAFCSLKHSQHPRKYLLLF